MSDLTAAQLIEHLRVLAHSTGTPYQIRRDRMLAAATFIEQQAKQIAKLTADSADWRGIAIDNQNSWYKAESEASSLREVIEDAILYANDSGLMNYEENNYAAGAQHVAAILSKALPEGEAPDHQ